MNYPVVLHKDKTSDYGVAVPDLPGCFSAGRTVDEALAMAKEAIELHLEGLIAQGQSIPRPCEIDHHQRNPQYRGGLWAVVSIDPAGLRVHAKRVNITVPERVLDAVDRFARERGQTRSGLLVEAATEFMGRAGNHTYGRRRAILKRPRKGVVPMENQSDVKAALTARKKHGAVPLEQVKARLRMK
jgi:predicted RNase H-like HicB family nuclease